MDSRERLKLIISGEPADRCGFWMGNPHADTWPIYFDHFGVATKAELRLRLGDDFRWHPAGVYRHPQDRPLFPNPEKVSHGTPGPFAKCRDPHEIDAYEWPNPDYLDFTEVIESLRSAGPYYRASGFWTPFYHNVMDLFGMEMYMVNMMENPALVHAVTDRVCEFYYEANERFFDQAGSVMDGYFFGNDFGTQLDLICGPSQFDEFVMPWFRKFTDQALRRGYQVIRVCPDLSTGFFIA